MDMDNCPEKEVVPSSLEETSSFSEEDCTAGAAAEVGYKVARWTLRKIHLRDRRKAAANTCAGETSWCRCSTVPAKRSQRTSRSKSKPKNQNSNRGDEQTSLFKGIWGGIENEKRRKPGPSRCIFLPAPEDKFLEDMLSDNPQYKSNSQEKAIEDWEKAAAVLPVYQGPYSPPPPDSPLW